ncbi:hypothetical protein BC567DRAFT_223636 [Phyllosticta citribraziliensis]
MRCHAMRCHAKRNTYTAAVSYASHNDDLLSLHRPTDLPTAPPHPQDPTRRRDKGMQRQPCMGPARAHDTGAGRTRASERGDF